ncbi:MAG: 4-hydroxy-tetrahydrodipicolinate reductase [Lachnospiraceae bacterium]|nr:4-hydroxy-tetrahydrodipicolinate reductase [Lachnospiraceae bacterium]
MVKILMRGCNGRMGRMITSIVKETEGAEITVGLDLFDGVQNDYPVFKTIDEVNVDFDVVIDFSSADESLNRLLDYCVENGKGIVLCTTGLSEEQLNKVKEASAKTAILKSANMSLGINLLLKLIKEATKTLADEGFDIEIVEKHHNQKLDAPSGTALALGDAVNAELNNEYEYVYDRSQRREKRPKKEIGFSAVRGGTIVGDHDVIYAGQDEVITLSHTAYSRAVFAKGAVAAAKFLKDCKPGMYDMSHVIG